jgi:hypothetical protein
MTLLPNINVTPAALWGKIGVRIHDAATSLYEKSKKSVVGDGSFAGFVHATISQVPHAATASSDSYGYLIYSQNGTVVQRRSSDILPGDIVVLQDAKFKGHRGLQSYTQNVGFPEAVVCIISEFELKKSKIRVFQANQHVGQQVCCKSRVSRLISDVIIVLRQWKLSATVSKI